MILLSFDTEEFDMPFEYGKSLAFDEQVAITVAGTHIVLGLLRKYQVRATFFCTANLADHAPELIEQIVTEGHEVASHGYYHSVFKNEHLQQSKDRLEAIAKTAVLGYRMPRMMPVDEKELSRAGYLYNTSVNPTFLPGRYNHLKEPRTFFYREGVLQIPASVSPVLRIPLFWLSFHNFPLFFYKRLCKQTYKKDGYLNLYFHPWEFINIESKKKYGFPGYVCRNSGQKMTERFQLLIEWMKHSTYPFASFKTFSESSLVGKRHD